VLASLLLAALLSACAGAGGERQDPGGRKTIVVTYSVLGAVVRELTGDVANVVVPMPNGQDPH
jgi:ABC-type Zn uptake system ZnuABC Zn-binding protein ZnuA